MGHGHDGAGGKRSQSCAAGIKKWSGHT